MLQNVNNVTREPENAVYALYMLFCLFETVSLTTIEANVCQYCRNRKVQKTCLVRTVIHRIQPKKYSSYQ